MKTRLYLQLGRAGDILNVLPLCKSDFDRTGVRPVLIVAAAYRSLLEGVTYVEPVVFPGEFENMSEAWALAEELAAAKDLAIVCTQIYGDATAGQTTAFSFLRQSWDRVPGAPPWGSLPLVFDRRDPTREAGVINALRRNGRARPYIVTALAGTSSPFEHGPALLRYLRAKLGREFEIVDVSGFAAARFYDLLGLLEGAHAIVAIDSGVLHLAHAAPAVPVVAFITRDPNAWHGSAWRPQHVARFFYDEAPECFAAVVDELVRSNGRAVVRRLPMIVHAYAHFGTVDEETERRIDLARETWLAEWKTARWLPIEFPQTERARTSLLPPISDERPVPFVKDMLARAEKIAADEDILAITNADVCLVPGITGKILDACARGGAAFTHRWDFDRLDRPLRSESEVAANGKWYPGSDAFFVSVAWWRRHGSEFPDMLLGRERWDEVFRQLVKRHGGREIHAAIYHERHASFWEAGDNRAKNPGNLHNRRLAHRWFLRTGYGPNDHEWWQLPASARGD
jgi:hypothetical protein